MLSDVVAMVAAIKAHGSDGTMVLVFDHADGVTSMMSLVAM